MKTPGELTRPFALLLLAFAVAAAPGLAADPPTSIPAPPDVAAPPEGAERTDSGLTSLVLQEGTGTEHPKADDLVKVHYTGWTTDGKMFDSSVVRGEPAGLPLDRVIAGWREGVQLMVTGEKRRLWIPEELAYAGREGAPPGMLVFDIELLAFSSPFRPPEVPEDVAAPPADAEFTKSGLASKVLREGNGEGHPLRRSWVTVHYTGWTTDGQMFDSSVMRREPAGFQLSQVIKGWTEGLQLMVPGEIRRFWIPEKLAYRGEEGKPAGMLVFDVELISFSSR